MNGQDKSTWVGTCRVVVVVNAVEGVVRRSTSACAKTTDRDERGYNLFVIGGIYLIGSVVHITGVAYPLELHDVASVPDSYSRSQAERNGHILGPRGRNGPCLWIRVSMVLRSLFRRLRIRSLQMSQASLPAACDGRSCLVMAEECAL